MFSVCTLIVDDGAVGNMAMIGPMFPLAVNTNHRCIWHRLVAVCDASFKGCEPSLGKEWGGHGVEDGIPE